MALALLTTVGTAAAQYYPAETAAQPVEEPAPGTAEVPAAIDPYGSSGAPARADVSPGVAPIMAPPAAGGYANANPGYPAGAASGQQPAGYPAQASTGYGASQPGYPTGAYSGQQPAGYPAVQQPTSAPAQAATGYGAGQPGYPTGAYSGQQPAGYGAPTHVAPTYPQQEQAAGATGATVATLPPEDQPEEGPPKELPANLKRQVVDYPTSQAPGTIVIDTPNTYLYYILPGGKAERYGIGVGRDGFTWAGTEKISAKKEWADWRPPAEMIERQPYLPRFMAGGPGNPLGARTMYLGGTVYRIHGTNQPSTIGQFMSSGCIRMLNEDVEYLYDKVKIGSKVVVMPGNPAAKTADGSAVMQPTSTPMSAVGPNAVPAVAVR